MARKNQLQWALETWNEGRKTARRPPSFGWFVFQKSSLRVHPCTGSGKAARFCALISRKVNAVFLVGFGNSSAFHSHLFSVVRELQHAWGFFRTLTGKVTGVPKHGSPLSLLLGCRKRLFATCNRNSWINGRDLLEAIASAGMREAWLLSHQVRVQTIFPGTLCLYLHILNKEMCSSRMYHLQSTVANVCNSVL